jgi:hypothetical protein
MSVERHYPNLTNIGRPNLVSIIFGGVGPALVAGPFIERGKACRRPAALLF